MMFGAWIMMKVLDKIDRREWLESEIIDETKKFIKHRSKDFA